MKIGPLTKSDTEDYFKLIQKVILGTPYYSLKARKAESVAYTPEWLRKNIQNKKALLLCAKDGPEVIGFLYGYAGAAGLLHLYWLGVDSEYRKQGVAEKLMRAAEVWAKKKAHKIWFDTRTNNKQSIPLARKLKYKKVATFKNHYYGQDFFIWEKVL